MISNKLFTEVIRHTVIDSSDADSDNDIGYTLEDSTYAYINIYELAHKCKEWAWKTHNKIVSSEVSVDDWVSIVAYFYGNLTVNIEESFSAETEPKAIFKACQWILDKKGTK